MAQPQTKKLARALFDRVPDAYSREDVVPARQAMGRSALPMPPEIAHVYFEFDWDKRKVWALDVAPQLIDRRLLDWHLELPFWSSEPPAPLFDIVPRTVMKHAAAHPVHAERIARADLSFPIDVMEHQGRLCVLDGLHRLAKATMEPRAMLPVRNIPRDQIPVIRQRLA
jgi:hypothetical protein